MQAALLFLLFSFLIILGILISMLYVVRQQSVAIVERFGRYQKIATSGIHMRLPFGIDKIAARIQLRLLQSEIVVETKTKDNVFVMMNVATQYRVNEQNVTDAYYKLMRPEAQIKSYIEDALRSSVPKLTLDELFEKKDEIALEVQHQVAEEMTTYGYIIVKTLITKVEPDAEVKQSMNEINAAQRKRVAAQELAEADKIKIVTAAEAEAEKDRLHIRGTAHRRIKKPGGQHLLSARSSLSSQPTGVAVGAGVPVSTGASVTAGASSASAAAVMVCRSSARVS